jgi:NAD(P)-dependent dehydrogenase (short-subunit alcohol dehydrogenase family)
MAAVSRKVVIVTGASTGLGLALAQILSSTGQYKVYATARQPNKSEELQKLAKDRADTLELLALDVTKENTIQEAINHVLQKDARIDVLVNNAGISLAKTTEQSSMAEFHEVFDTNLFGVVATCKAVIPHMRNAKSGHIINISSIGGILGQPFNDAYCSAKFALSGLSESMYITLNPLGVKVSLVCPGGITTPFFAKAYSSVIPPGENNPYSELQTAYVETIKKVMAGAALSGIKTAQTAEEVAGFVKGIIEAEKPNFMYFTSDYVSSMASAKLVDLSGNSVVDYTTKRNFGDAIIKK